MNQRVLTGTRIRERRTVQGIKQADLAQRAGISASYLNLIEHNRRRIGGKLLLAIAQELDVEPQVLSEGAEAELLASLHAAASVVQLPEAEAVRADEFAGRFPGWAEALATMHQRVDELEHRVEVLSDRIMHDPQLAASVHELLTTVASVRSTASILTRTETLEPEWRDRFLANIDEDSRRLADSAEVLVRYLDKGALQTRLSEPRTPEEGVQKFMARHAYHFPGLENANGSGGVSAVISAAPELENSHARQLAAELLQQAAADAAALPLDRLALSVDERGIEPLSLSKTHGVDLPCVLRRIAALPDLGAGLIVCDQLGKTVLSKQGYGIDLPSIGDTCQLEPIFEAQAQIGKVVRQRIRGGEPEFAKIDCFAITEAIDQPEYNRAPVTRTTMLAIRSKF